MKRSSDAAAVLARCKALQREREELARFALIGQAFVGLAHDLNNALNSIMLQASVVQSRVDAEVRQELAVVRQHAAQAAGLVRSLQHVVQERREKSYAVDLDSVLAEVLNDEAELRRRLSMRAAARTATAAPPLHSTRSAVKLLLRLLLEGVCAGTKAPVKATTGEEEDAAALSLTFADAAADLGSDDSSPSVDALLWQNLDEVSRLAGQALLRQLGGVVTAERDDDGTFHLRIIWRQSA